MSFYLLSKHPSDLTPKLLNNEVRKMEMLVEKDLSNIRKDIIEKAELGIDIELAIISELSRRKKLAKGELYLRLYNKTEAEVESALEDLKQKKNAEQIEEETAYKL